MFHPLAPVKRRQRLPLCLVVTAVSVATMCSLTWAPFAFTSQLRRVGGNAKISPGSAELSLSSTAKFVGGTSVRCHAQLETGCGETAFTPWNFRSGCILLCCAFSASIALSPKRRHGWQSTKARRAAAKCSVAGFAADSLPGTIALPVSYTQGSVPSAAPAMSIPPVSVMSPVTLNAAGTLKQQHGLPATEQMLPATPAVAVSRALVHDGLSSMRPTVHAGTARRARRRVGVGNHTPRASPSGRTRSARRAVGAWLQPKVEIQAVPREAWDPSRLRTQLQLGFQVVRRSRQPRKSRRLSTCSCCIELARVLPLSALNVHDRKS